RENGSTIEIRKKYVIIENHSHPQGAQHSTSQNQFLVLHMARYCCFFCGRFTRHIPAPAANPWVAKILILFVF
ncbi:hypothetical protein, partial [Thiolapillus sp.]|uniref:hypothetical protein n=1 Tax=Thiolapillus sp. TaxID=2017437 RepID=UPI003AF5276F